MGRSHILGSEVRNSLIFLLLITQSGLQSQDVKSVL